MDMNSTAVSMYERRRVGEKSRRGRRRRWWLKAVAKGVLMEAWVRVQTGTTDINGKLN